MFHLTASQTALLIAVPVLLGALARLPMGLLTDRYKGRAVFTALMIFAAIPPLLISTTSNYSMLLGVAFLMGMAGSSFAVGVGFVSRNKAPRSVFTDSETSGNRRPCFLGRFWPPASG